MYERRYSSNYAMLIICSSSSYIEVDWSTPASVRLFTVPVDISTAANQHGVAKIGEKVK